MAESEYYYDLPNLYSLWNQYGWSYPDFLSGSYQQQDYPDKLRKRRNFFDTAQQDQFNKLFGLSNLQTSDLMRLFETQRELQDYQLGRYYEQTGLADNLQSVLLNALGISPEGQLTDKGQQLQGMREGFTNLAGLYQGLGAGGQTLSEEDLLAQLPEGDRQAYLARKAAYEGLMASQTAGTGEYLGSTALEDSLAQARKIAEEQAARGGMRVGSTANAQLQSKLSSQEAVARDLAQQQAIQTYGGLAGQLEGTWLGKQAGLGSAINNFSSGITAGLENIGNVLGLNQIAPEYTFATPQYMNPTSQTLGMLEAPTSQAMDQYYNWMYQGMQNQFTWDYGARQNRYDWYFNQMSTAQDAINQQYNMPLQILLAKLGQGRGISSGTSQTGSAIASIIASLLS